MLLHGVPPKLNSKFIFAKKYAFTYCLFYSDNLYRNLGRYFKVQEWQNTDILVSRSVEYTSVIICVHTSILDSHRKYGYRAWQNINLRGDFYEPVVTYLEWMQNDEELRCWIINIEVSKYLLLRPLSNESQ